MWPCGALSQSVQFGGNKGFPAKVDRVRSHNLIFIKECAASICQKSAMQRMSPFFHNTSHCLRTVDRVCAAVRAGCPAEATARLEIFIVTGEIVSPRQLGTLSLFAPPSRPDLIRFLLSRSHSLSAKRHGVGRPAPDQLDKAQADLAVGLPAACLDC